MKLRKLGRQRTKETLGYYYYYYFLTHKQLTYRAQTYSDTIDLNKHEHKDSARASPGCTASACCTAPGPRAPQSSKSAA